jgi:hypothetical protein
VAFEVLHRHLPRGIVENNENPVRIAGLWAEILKPGPPNRKAGVPATRLRRSVPELIVKRRKDGGAVKKY